MGELEPCCEERRKNRNNYLNEYNNNILMNNTSLILQNLRKNKKIHKKYNFDNELKVKEDDPNINIPIKKIKNGNKKGIEYIQKFYEFNNIKKKTIIKYFNMDYDENEMINNKYNKHYFMKGKLISEGRFDKIYLGLSSNGDIITMKIYNNLSDLQKIKIIKNFDYLYKLNHKNIIKAIPILNLNIYNEPRDFTLIYEYFNSKNVEYIINKFGNLDEKIIQIYSKQLLEGLKYLHENNIYHKNLKPNSIFVESDGTIKIFDCFVDNLLLGNSKEYYEYLLKSDKIEYYIPPFFIKSINEYKEKNNKINNNFDNISENNGDNIFNDWKSFDLYYIGCLIIEIFTKKKPWAQYSFQNNLKLFEFLGTTNFLPDIPKNLSRQCKELLNILFDYSLTKKPDIYDKILNLDFFQIDISQFTCNKNSNIIETNSSLNNSNNYSIINQDSNYSINNNKKKSEKQLGISIENNNNNTSFFESFKIEDNIYSLTYKKKNTNSNKK